MRVLEIMRSPENRGRRLWRVKKVPVLLRKMSSLITGVQRRLSQGQLTKEGLETAKVGRSRKGGPTCGSMRVEGSLRARRGVDLRAIKTGFVVGSRKKKKTGEKDFVYS